MKTTTNGQSLLQHRAWGSSRILTSFFGVRRNSRLHLVMIVTIISLAIPSRLPADDKCLHLIRSQIKICERQFSTVRNIGGKKVALINVSLPSFQITFASHPALYVQQVTLHPPPPLLLLEIPLNGSQILLSHTPPWKGRREWDP